MAPSATAAPVTPNSKAQVSATRETHFHGAEDKTPLEAISHGPFIQPGMYMVWYLYYRQVRDVCHEAYALGFASWYDF